MKKNLLFIAIMILCVSTQAQLTIAPQIGGGESTLKMTSTAIGSIKNVPSYYAEAGAEVRYQVLDFLSIETGALYQYSMQKYTTSLFGLVLLTTNNTLHYINLPLEVVYRKRKGGFYGGAGVNFGLGISGKQEQTSFFGTKTTKSYKFDGKVNTTADPKQHLKFLNTGINAKLGYSFKSFFIGANTTIGLSNVSPDKTPTKISLKTATYGIHLGWALHCGKEKMKHKK